MTAQVNLQLSQQCQTEPEVLYTNTGVCLKVRIVEILVVIGGHMAVRVVQSVC